MKSTNDIMYLVAEEIAKNNEWLLNELHKRYVRPLQETAILKKKVVAKRLKVSPGTVTGLIDTGKLQTTVDGCVSEYHLWDYLMRHVKFNSQIT